MLTNSDFLKGTLTTLILSLLDQNGKMYGYEICQKTKTQTNNKINLTEGAIYPALHKLEKQGLIVSSKLKVNGRTRKYYAISSPEKQTVNDQILALQQFMNSLSLVIKPA
ncbi:PadR family transcriptional regulator [Saprospiraceae bacterium]|nr:PadR family transcriptional regulator [Saprospiraceae bacterium]